jgi:hypothetical protein
MKQLGLSLIPTVQYVKPGVGLEDTVIIKGRDVIEYLRLRKEGYVTLWSGEGKICLKAPKAVTE